MYWSTRCISMWGGSGSWTRTPWIDGGVQLLDPPQHGLARRRLGEEVLLGMDAELAAGAHLVADVHLRGRVLADHDDGEPGRDPLGAQALDVRFPVGADALGDLHAVDDLRRHAAPPRSPTIAHSSMLAHQRIARRCS
jgi:hypothetical protein